MHSARRTHRHTRLLALIPTLAGLLLAALLPARGPIAEAAGACPASQSHLVPWQGGRWYLSGVNVPWQDGGFGADFATIEEWGQHTYSSSATRAMFADLQSRGVNSVRWWVFADGRGAPEFNSSSGGAVTGFDATTLPSMADAIKLAAEHDIYIVFNLWTFEMLSRDHSASERGEHAGGHRDLIVDAAKRKSFIDNAVIPMLQHPIPGTGHTIGSHPNVLGWDIINEPEWAIAEANTNHHEIPQPVSLAEMQRFVAEVAGAFNRNTGQLVTVGSASLKWHSDTIAATMGHWWKDANLTRYDPDGALDFYQIHYYGWMNGDSSWSYSPLKVDWATAGLDKPTVVGEFPANALDTGLGVAGMLDAIHDRCYGGAWAWSYEGVDFAGGWSDLAEPIGAFNAAHKAETRISGSGTPTGPVAPPRGELTNRLYLPMLTRSR